MNEDRLVEFFDAWNAHDIELIMSFFAAEGAFHASIGTDDEGTVFRGLENVRRGVAAFFESYEDVRFTDVNAVSFGDRGHVSWAFHGVHTDQGPISYRGVDLFEFDGDQILLKDAYRKQRSDPDAS